MAEEIIRETISVTRTQISDEDKAISADYNRIVREALRQADILLRFGTPSQKMRLITAAMSSAGRLASVDSKVEVQVARTQFEQMLDEMRMVPELEQIITGPDAQERVEFIDVAASSLPQSSQYQNDRE